MAAPVELNDRQKTVIRILNELGPGHTAAEIADATGLGDPRGVAQTIRRMPEYVEKAPKGGYRLTRRGKTQAAKMAGDAEQVRLSTPLTGPRR